MLQDTTNIQGIPPPEPFPVDPCAPPSISTPSAIPRSTSTRDNSNKPSHRPSTPSSTATGNMSWREEESILKHQLRSAKAEIAQLQAKLGIAKNAVPFNSSSPSRKILNSTSSPSTSPELSHSLSDRQLSVSPTSLRTRRVSSASSTHSTEASAPPPTSPLPPVPPIPQAIVTPAATTATNVSPTRIPVPTSSNSGYAPVGPVALNRALLSNEGQSKSPPSRSPSPLPSTAVTNDSIPTVVNTTTTRTTTSGPPSPSSSDLPEDIDRSLSPPPILLAARQSRLSDPTYTRTAQYLSSTSRPENPFFSSGTPARERLSKSASSAMSGSGKVISGLQSELLQAKNALESTRGQLRLSQRAVDFLGRQNEDLKETKERLNTEIESLTRQLNRRERTTEETLSRARLAEASLATLQTEHKTYVSTHKSRTKDLEESEKKSREELKRVEMEYENLRDGMRSMQNGWKRDLDWLKQSLGTKEKELEQKSRALEKLLASRSEVASSLSSTVSSLSETTTKFNSTFANETSTALRSLELLGTRQKEDSDKVEIVRGEMGRLRRNIERAERGEKEREVIEQ
ncbi:hypothetical protein JCM5350_006853 [Sporobolomyces pararoseus]